MSVSPERLAELIAKRPWVACSSADDELEAALRELSERRERDKTHVPTPRTPRWCHECENWHHKNCTSERELAQAAERIAELERQLKETRQSRDLQAAAAQEFGNKMTEQSDRIRVLTEALELVLIFYKPGPWTAEMKRWKEIAGDIPPHTAGLCDFIRSALSDIGASHEAQPR